LKWGETNRRNFVWRKTCEPYKILIAELLLQRTVAEQVEPIYIKFLKRFPSIEDLSNAKVSEIAHLIKPLGLAYRAARLKRIAIEIARYHNGKIPSTKTGLLELYGIGNYVAHAVLCFAYGMDVSIVDTNVKRIVSRYFGLALTSESHKDETLWQLMQDLVPRGKAREFNWALLDFAKLVCKPRTPNIETCPLSASCLYARKRYI
jgi:A/G-specific adenine glycosylase